MSITVCYHNCYFGFVNRNKDIFLLNKHIWKCQNINSHYLISPVKYLVEIFRNFQAYYSLSNDRRMKVEIIHVSKIALVRSCLFQSKAVKILCLECSNDMLK